MSNVMTEMFQVAVPNVRLSVVGIAQKLTLQ
jgi:hypothetical protein